MVTRNNNAKKNPDPAPRTGGESSAVPGGTFPSDALGDGSVRVPINRDRHHGTRSERGASVWGDVMQRWVGGGEVKEHEYADTPDAPDADEGRDKR